MTAMLAQKVDSKACFVGERVSEVEVMLLYKLLPARGAHDFVHDAREPLLVDRRFVRNGSEMPVHAPDWGRACTQVQVTSLQFEHASQPGVNFSHGLPPPARRLFRD